jgi:hypothetical protein
VIKSGKQHAIFTSGLQNVLRLKVEFSKTYCKLMIVLMHYKFGNNLFLFIFNIQNANVNVL